MRLVRASAVLACLIGVAPLLADGIGGSDAILGVWVTEPGASAQAHVKIEKTGGTYSGEIVWLSQPDEEAPRLDQKNPDPALRDRPLVGIRLVHDFEYVGRREWAHGTIYDPETGKTYKCRMRLTDDGALRVRGYVGLPLLGRTTVWTRLPPTGG